MTTNDTRTLGTVVICTALEVEYQAVREHLQGPLKEHEKSGSLYEVARFPTERGTWTVVLTQTGAGNSPAGAHLERAIGEFDPEIVLFVGVAGGIKDVELGDVVAADHVYDYETGKDTAAGYQARAKTAPGAYRLVERARKIARTGEWQPRIRPSQPASAPHALIKPIAAGSKVVADRESTTAQLLRERFGDAVAVEMEGHGFLYTAYMNRQVEALVVRGISDLLTDKNEVADQQWQPIASHHAAAFAFELLNQLPPPDATTTGQELTRQNDMAAVRAVTEANLLVLDDHATLPGEAGRFAVDRAEIPMLLDAEGSFVLVGEPGCGKSGALNRLAHEMIDRGEDVVLLTVDTIGARPGEIGDGVELSRPLLNLLQDWQGSSRATLLVDGLDASRGGPLTWLVNLIRELSRSRWRVIATMRRFDLRNSQTWTQTFAGAPVSDQVQHVDNSLRRVRHFLLGAFSSDELEVLAGEHPDVAQLITGASVHLIDLVRTPFNLRLACELLESGVNRASLAEARDQLELLQKYWEVRVARHVDSPARLRTLEHLSAAMLTRRALRANAAILPDTLLDARTALVQDGVINEIPSRFKAGGAPSITYSHHILFDYSVAALILTRDDESRLVAALQDDPNLVLVARPSIDLHLADLWHLDDNRGYFAQVVAAIAQHGDSLTGVAAVRTFVAEARSDTDVRWLTELSVSEPKTFSIVIGWLAGVLGADDDALRQCVRNKIELWVDVLAAGTAQIQKNFTHAMVNQVDRLLKQLHTQQAMTLEVPGAVLWATSVVALMRVALEAPADREPLGMSLVRYLPRAVAIDPSHGEVLRDTLKPEIAAAWRPLYLFYYVSEAEGIAGADPDLAIELLATVLGRGEAGDETIPLFQGVVSLLTTPKQDLESAQYEVGRVIPRVLGVTGLARAMDVLVAALPVDVNGDGYPITCRSVHGQVDMFGRELRHGRAHGVAAIIVTGFADALGSLDLPTDELDGLVNDFVSRIRHPGAWRAILTAAAGRPADVGVAFLPTLASGGLLAHSHTRAAAGKLIKAVSPLISPGQQQELERAILAAPQLFSDPSDEEIETLLGQLVGCLTVDAIQDASLAERRHLQQAAEGPPTIPEPQGSMAMLSPTTLTDYLGEQDTELTDPQQRNALDTLRVTVEGLPPNLEPEHATALEDALRVALALGVGGPQQTEPGAELVFRAIEHLVRYAPPEPGSELASLVMPLLLAAAAGQPANGSDRKA
ncbi:hypothetical protein [Amycolatopsis sp. cmx-4-83]|uniref:phosphorylase family protein n=1 Tax=Amycolatopsis sp. cmx-4-83 TaxID=2790940 RepID=UPI00397BDA1F